jgi:hypothetical protein
VLGNAGYRAQEPGRARLPSIQLETWAIGIVPLAGDLEAASEALAGPPIKLSTIANRRPE